MTKKEIIKELKEIRDFLVKPLNNTCEDCRQTEEQTRIEINRLIKEINLSL